MRSVATAWRSLRYALIVSIGGAIPLRPTPSAGRVPQHIARTRVISRAELASLPVSSSPVVWNNAVFAFVPGDFAKAATLQPADYVPSDHPAAPEGAWSRQGQVMVERADAPPRSIQAKSLDIYSVNYKGEVGDGKTDNNHPIKHPTSEGHP